MTDRPNGPRLEHPYTGEILEVFEPEKNPYDDFFVQYMIEVFAQEPENENREESNQ